MSQLHRQGWSISRVLGAIALMACGLFAASDAWLDILQIARRDEEASHIFLVPIVFVWLAWVRRGRLRHIEARTSWCGPVVILIGWTLMRLGDAQLWQSIWHFGALCIVVGCALTVVGPQVLFHFAPAFFVLLFLIPIPGRVRQEIAIPMQNATARVTETIFELIGMPVVRSGNLLTVNGVEVAIAEACNGLRMVFALTLVCYAFAFGNPLRPFARLLVVLASPLAAILCNVVRLIPTVYVYGHYSPKVAEDFHTISGWLMLLVAFLLLMGILRLLRWALIPVYRFNLAYE